MKVGSVSVTRDGMLIVPGADCYILAISLANWKEVCVCVCVVCVCVCVCLCVCVCVCVHTHIMYVTIIPP